PHARSWHAGRQRLGGIDMRKPGWPLSPLRCRRSVTGRVTPIVKPKLVANGNRRRIGLVDSVSVPRVFRSCPEEHLAIAGTPPIFAVSAEGQLHVYGKCIRAGILAVKNVG